MKKPRTSTGVSEGAESEGAEDGAAEVADDRLGMSRSNQGLRQAESNGTTLPQKNSLELCAKNEMSPPLLALM